MAATHPVTHIPPGWDTWFAMRRQGEGGGRRSGVAAPGRGRCLLHFCRCFLGSRTYGAMGQMPAASQPHAASS